MSTRNHSKNCLVCLHPINESSKLSKSSKIDHLDKLKKTLSTFGQLIGLPLYINDSGFDKIVLQSINFCVRCSNTFQRIYYELEELKSLESRLKKSKDEIQNRILGIPKNENEDLNPFTIEYRNIILKGIKSNLAKETTDSITKPIMPHTTRIKKEKIDEYEESSTSTSNGGVWNMLKKEIRVSLKPLQIDPCDFGKTFILLDQLKLNQNNNFGTSTSKDWTEEDIDLYSKATSTDDLEIIIECEETRKKLRRKKSEVNYDEDTLVAQNIIQKQESAITITNINTSNEKSPTTELETKAKPKPKRIPKPKDGRKARPHVCKECNRGFRHLWHLEVHENTHTGATPFKCEHCDEAFASGTLRSQHSIAAHINYNKYPCDICKKYFPSNSELLKHSREDHNISPFKCSICQMELASKRWLITHKSRMHRPGRITKWNGPKSTTLYTGPKRPVGRPRVYDENNPKPIKPKPLKPQSLLPKRPVGRPRIYEPKVRVKHGSGQGRSKNSASVETDYANKEPDHVCGICFQKFYHFYDLNKHLVSHTRLSKYDGTNGTNENDVYIDNNEDDMDESENIYQEDDEELPDFLRMDYQNNVDEDTDGNIPVIYSVASLCEQPIISTDKDQQANNEEEPPGCPPTIADDFTDKNTSNTLNGEVFFKTKNNSSKLIEGGDSLHSESNSNTASDSSAETNVMDKEASGRKENPNKSYKLTSLLSAENNCKNQSNNSTTKPIIASKALKDIEKIISKHMGNPNIESETEFPLITVKSLETLKVHLPIDHNRGLYVSEDPESKNKLLAHSSNSVSANTIDKVKEKLFKSIPKENSNFAKKLKLSPMPMKRSDKIKCKVCGILIQRRCYKNHLSRIHYKLSNRIQCQICLKTMKAETLKKHERLHHSNHRHHQDTNFVKNEERVRIKSRVGKTINSGASKIGQKSPMKKENESNFDGDQDEVQCTVCLKYINQINMKSHMKITHRAKGYQNKQGYKQCSVCSRIVGKSNFARHFRLHNADLPKRKFKMNTVESSNNNKRNIKRIDNLIQKKSPRKMKTNSPSSSFVRDSSVSPSKGQKSLNGVKTENPGLGKAIEVETQNSLNKLLQKFVKMSGTDTPVEKRRGAEASSSSSKKTTISNSKGKTLLHNKYKASAKLTKCEICEKSILSCSLGRHIRLVHIGIKDFTCTEVGCKKSFSTKQIMERHAKALHKK